MRPDVTRLRPRGGGQLSPSTTAILITLIVVGSLALVAVAIFLHLRSRSEQRYRNASAADPYLTRREFKRRSKMSPTQRIEEDELQRRIMIRKSLASRTSTRTTHDDVDSDIEASMAQIPGARVYHPDERTSPRRQRSRGRLRALYTEIVPPRASSPSPDRSPLLVEGPQVPPRHPDRVKKAYHGLDLTPEQPPQIEVSSLVFGGSLQEDGRIHRFIW
ncbi:hypothetical protein F5X68DRAFT_29652 [Plectosphaerella plurivora]|uniref:Uncharacterized protein n=1 Tax=Plectosphaerella plurivora TaxID=936078 RepID=A0A9P8VKG3_9PEZI|nr:hypothetical protein F5X68DRAFT_29652 [Plectosphaerella plurivora]